MRLSKLLYDGGVQGTISHITDDLFTSSLSCIVNFFIRLNIKKYNYVETQYDFYILITYEESSTFSKTFFVKIPPFSFCNNNRTLSHFNLDFYQEKIVLISDISTYNIQVSNTFSTNKSLSGKSQFFQKKLKMFLVLECTE